MYPNAAVALYAEIGVQTARRCGKPSSLKTRSKHWQYMTLNLIMPTQPYISCILTPTPMSYMDVTYSFLTSLFATLPPFYHESLLCAACADLGPYTRLEHNISRATYCMFLPSMSMLLDFLVLKASVT